MSGGEKGAPAKSLLIGAGLGLALFFALRLCTQTSPRLCIGLGGVFGIFCAGACYPLLLRRGRAARRLYRDMERAFSEPILDLVDCLERIVLTVPTEGDFLQSKHLCGGKLYFFARGFVFFSAEQLPTQFSEYHYHRLENCTAHGRCLYIVQPGGDVTRFVLKDQKAAKACSERILAQLSAARKGE